MTLTSTQLAGIPAIRENAAREAARLLASGKVSPAAGASAPELGDLPPLPDIPEWRLVAEHDILPIAKACGHVVSSSDMPNDERILSCTGRTMYSQLRMLSTRFWSRPWDEKRALLACGFLPGLQPKDKPLAIDPEFVCEMLDPARDPVLSLSFPYSAYLSAKLPFPTDMELTGYPYPTLEKHVFEFARIEDKVPEGYADRIRSAIDTAFEQDSTWYHQSLDMTYDDMVASSKYSAFDDMLVRICDGLEPDTISFQYRGNRNASVLYTDANGHNVKTSIQLDRYSFHYQDDDGIYHRQTLQNAFAMEEDGSYDAVPLKNALDIAIESQRETARMEKLLSNTMKLSTNAMAHLNEYMSKLHFEKNDDAPFGYDISNPNDVSSPPLWNMGISASSLTRRRDLESVPPSRTKPDTAAVGAFQTTVCAHTDCPSLAAADAARNVIAMSLVYSYPTEGVDLHVFAPYLVGTMRLRDDVGTEFKTLCDELGPSSIETTAEGHLVFHGREGTLCIFEALMHSIAHDPESIVLFES